MSAMAEMLVQGKTPAQAIDAVKVEAAKYVGGAAIVSTLDIDSLPPFGWHTLDAFLEAAKVIVDGPKSVPWRRIGLPSLRMKIQFKGAPGGDEIQQYVAKSTDEANREKKREKRRRRRR